MRKILLLAVLFLPIVGMAQSKYNSAYSRLFTPVQFYGDVLDNYFNLDSDTLTVDERRQVEEVLMSIYLRHPELVERVARQESQKEIDIENQRDTLKALISAKEIVIPEAEEIDAAPVSIIVKKPNFWKIDGDYYLQMMQNSYSTNWYQGGESNYAVLGKVAMDFNYNNKQKICWENKLEMEAGLQTYKGDSIHRLRSSSDLLRLTNRLGIQATKHWYYTLQSVASTQFMKTYETNSRKMTSGFLAPLTWNVSVGMDYKINWLNGKFTGNFHVAPMAMNYTYVKDKDLATRFDVEEGKHGKVDWGPNLSFEAVWKMGYHVEWKTRFYAFSTFKRTELQWENTFNFNLTRFLAVCIYLYPRYDDQSVELKDDKLGYFQFKEYTSLGFNFSF